MTKVQVNDKVTVETADPADDEYQAAREKLAEAAARRDAARTRAATVEALKTELAFLERQPVPNERRLAEVKKQISVYSGRPARAARPETA